MPRSAQDHDHQSGDTPRSRPRHARQGSRRQSLVAGLLGVLGFIVLLGYAVLGAGGHAAHAADATVTVHVKQSTIGTPGCEGSGSVRTGVFFVITGVSAATAPASVHVVWSDGSESDVPLLSTQGNNAHYSADFPPGVTGITDATAVVPADWDGQFNVSHYLCGEPSTTTPPPPTTSTAPPPTTSTPPPTTSTPPPSTTTAPPPSTSTPPLTSTAPPSTSTPPMSTPASTSPFVPGPGQTGDSGPGANSLLKKVLLGVALALLTSAAALAIRPLRRRGNHT